MGKIDCFVRGKYKNFKNLKISCILKKALVLSFICSNCGGNDENIFKKENSWFNQ